MYVQFVLQNDQQVDITMGKRIYPCPQGASHLHDNTWTMNLGSVETSTTPTREQKLQEQQAGTILWTSIDQLRTLGEHCEKEENQYELYHTKTDS